MATRVTASKVPWQNVLSSLRQGHSRQIRLQEMKNKVEAATIRVQQLPSEKGKINFDYYRERLPAALVDEFEKKYADEVPYYSHPELTEAKKSLEADRVTELENNTTSLKELDKTMESVSLQMTRAKLLPPRDEWTCEMKYIYFPEMRDYQMWLKIIRMRGLMRGYPRVILQCFERTEEENQHFSTKYF